MRYLTLAEVLDLHRRVIEQSGGADGVRDLGGVESAVANRRCHSEVRNLSDQRVEGDRVVLLARRESSIRGRQQADWPCGNGNVSRDERLRDNRGC